MSRAVHVTCGNHGGPKAQRGFEQYETPACVVGPLLQAEPVPRHILDPCGPRDSPLVQILQAHGHEVTAFDLVRDGIDFLKITELPPDIDCALTNPPFSKAADIVRHALTLLRKAIILQRVQFLESQGRATFFAEGKLSRVYYFVDRVPRMHRANWDGNRTSASMFLCWFVFQRDHDGSYPQLIPIWCDEAKRRRAFRATPTAAPPTNRPSKLRVHARSRRGVDSTDQLELDFAAPAVPAPIAPHPLDIPPFLRRLLS